MLDEREKARLLLDLRSQRRVTWAHFEKMSERRSFLEWLRVAAPQPVVPVSFSAGGDPWRQIVRASEGAGTVVVSGDELLWGTERDTWRRAFNLGRDSISDLHAPVVVLADAALLDEIAQRAPDLWSWRGTVIEGDYQPWDVRVPGPASVDTIGTDPRWATIGRRPDLYVQPGENTPFMTLLSQMESNVPLPGVRVQAVVGAGGHSFLHALSQSLANRAICVSIYAGWSGDTKAETLIRLLGQLSRLEALLPDLGDYLAALGRDLLLLLGQQYADLARIAFDGGVVPYGAGLRLSDRLRTPAVEAATSAAFDASLATLRRRGKSLLVLSYGQRYGANNLPQVVENLLGYGVPICAVTTASVKLMSARPPLDARIEDGIADAVIARRFPWLPSPLRERIVRWADGLPGPSMNVVQQLLAAPGGNTERTFTRVEVDRAVGLVAARLAAGPDHERLLGPIGEPAWSQRRIGEFWHEGFVRFPRDGGAPYFHPMWLLALGRSPDPDGPRIPVPGGGQTPAFLADIGLRTRADG